MSVEQNRKAVVAYCENFSAGNIDAVLALAADDATFWIAGKPERFALAGTKTKPEFAVQLKGVASAMPNGLRLTPRRLVAEGDLVAAEVDAYGTTANGRVYDNRYLFLFEFRDGKIVALREYFDTLHAKEVFLDP